MYIILDKLLDIFFCHVLKGIEISYYNYSKVCAKRTNFVNSNLEYQRKLEKKIFLFYHCSVNYFSRASFYFCHLTRSFKK